MKNFVQLYSMYVQRCIKDSFTIGYSVVFPLLMIGLLGWIRKGSFSNGVTSFQYYSVTMIPFVICCELITAAYQGQEEGRLKVAQRFLIAPISVKSLIFSKWCAGVTALSICHGFVYLTVKLVFQVSFGGKGLVIYLVSIELTAFIYALGLWLGLGMKNFLLIKNLVNLPIIVFAVLGGCFYPFGSLHSFVAGLIQLSPLTWINRASFLSMFDKENELIIRVLSILFIGVLAVLYQAMMRFKKEGFLYGESFNYNK